MLLLRLIVALRSASCSVLANSALLQQDLLNLNSSAFLHIICAQGLLPDRFGRQETGLTPVPKGVIMA